MGKMPKTDEKPPNHAYQKTALVLQGGGALGAYQAGVYESLDAHGIYPDWFAGVSIGAVNAAIMAGNPPEKRIEKLKSFWQEITETLFDYPNSFQDFFPPQTYMAYSSLMSMTCGIPGFFAPRILPPIWLSPVSGQNAVSYYDTSPLRDTLLKHADFERINDGNVRLSLGAVNVRTGNSLYFDNKNQTLTPEHVMASGALPPGFPPVEIDGECYWDGGLVSNTPLTYVLSDPEDADTLIFQVDLFSAVGDLPKSIDTVEERRKDIVYSSRTRLNTDAFRKDYELKEAITHLATHLPPDKRNDPAISKLINMGASRKISIVHLIYRPEDWEGASKDYEFSNRSMDRRWQAGLADGRQTCKQTGWRTLPSDEDGIAVYDLTPPHQPKA